MIVGITSVFVYVHVSICVCSWMLYMIYIYMFMYMYVGIFMSLYLCVCSVSMCVGIRITFVNRFTLSQWVLGSYSDVQVCVDSIFICGYKSLIYYLFDIILLPESHFSFCLLWKLMLSLLLFSLVTFKMVLSLPLLT